MAANSLLVAITGAGRTRGTAAVLGFPSTINQHLAYATPVDDRLDTNYLHGLFVGGYRALREISDDAGSTKGALTCRDIKNFRVLLPPREEQEEIVKAVARSTKHIDASVMVAEREIALLREFRERLIADVVTGQVDVREAAARLPPLPADEGPADLADADAPDDPDDADAEPNPDDA